MNNDIIDKDQLVNDLVVEIESIFVRKIFYKYRFDLLDVMNEGEKDIHDALVNEISRLYIGKDEPFDISYYKDLLDKVKHLHYYGK